MSTESYMNTLSYLELKKCLIEFGIPEAEVDKCPGKPTLLHLAYQYSDAGVAADLAAKRKLLTADLARIETENAEKDKEAERQQLHRWMADNEWGSTSSKEISEY